MEAPQKVIEISQPYVDEHLREFFEVNHTPVNIDNICLFSAKTIEEYNSRSETKLSGKQKLEASVELAKNIIDKTMVFVPEEDRRKVSKNIFHNIGSIESTIQFIVDISNNPNIINVGKWVRSDTLPKPSEPGFFKRLFCCRPSKPTLETKPSEPTPVTETADPAPETKPSEPTSEPTPETKPSESVEKKETKKEMKQRKKKEEQEKKEQAKKDKKEKEENKLKEKKELKEKAKREKEEKKKEKEERERKIKELLEETEKKVKELKGETKPAPQEKEVEIEI